jgi:hypothetical protein
MVAYHDKRSSIREVLLAADIDSEEKGEDKASCKTK